MRFEDDEDYKNDDIIEVPIIRKVKVKVGKIKQLKPEDYDTPLNPEADRLKQIPAVVRSKWQVIKIWFHRKWRQLHGWKEYQSEDYDKENGVRLIMNAMANPKTGEIWIYKERWEKLYFVSSLTRQEVEEI